MIKFLNEVGISILIQACFELHGKFWLVVSGALHEFIYPRIIVDVVKGSELLLLLITRNYYARENTAFN